MEPAMEAQGTMGSLIKRRVEADTIGVAFYLPQATSRRGRGRRTRGGGELVAGKFEVRLRCHVTMYISSACPGRTKECEYPGADAICHAVPDDEDGVRDALRGMLRSIRPLQDLGLTDGEWESIVPEDVVPLLVDPEARSRYGAAEVAMSVDRHVRYDAARVLMTGCKKRKKIDDDDDDGAAAAECSVCFDAHGGEAVVELPGCAHAFHRRCISKWFRRKTTCPLCRGDVVKHLHPELQKHIAEFRDVIGDQGNHM